MFNWLRNYLINRSRQIFSYWDGSQWLRGDPIALFRGLRTHKTFDLGRDLDLHDLEDPFSLFVDDEARQRAVAAVHEVFTVPDFTQTGKRRGLTDNECMALLKTFIAYVLDLKKSFSLSQTSAESIPPSSSSSQSFPLPPGVGTKPTSEPTSTSADQNGVLPETSPTVPEASSLQTSWYS